MEWSVLLKNSEGKMEEAQSQFLQQPELVIVDIMTIYAEDFMMPNGQILIQTLVETIQCTHLENY